jgi:3-phenylpropionate/cinnamic acid dioxygenase small subunit
MDERRSIEAFLFCEARLADEHAYADWEALWTDDALYWVPAADDSDPMAVMSVIHDNRRRIATRIKQLETGRRLAQAPQSRLRRMITNIEIGDPGAPDHATETVDVEVQANFVVYEARETGTHQWAGRVTYRLRPADASDGGPWKLSYKKVDLVDRPWTLPTLAFLI